MSELLTDTLELKDKAQRPADKNPLVSVVLGTYNRLQLLRHTINNIRAETCSMPRELIVIDGGSTDGTIEWLVQQEDIMTILQHNRSQDPQRPGPRRSWGYFMNLGFKVAQGKYVLMISDDCILLPGSLQRGIHQYEQKPSRSRVGGIAFYFRNWPEEERYYVQRTLGGKLMVNHGLFLRQALSEVGWIEEEYYTFYKADGDLSLKLWSKGYTIIEAAQSFVEHYMDKRELVRLENNQTHAEDADRYRARWKLHTALTIATNNMGKFYIEYVDDTHLAEKCFGSLHPVSGDHPNLPQKNK